MEKKPQRPLTEEKIRNPISNGRNRRIMERRSRFIWEKTLLTPEKIHKIQPRIAVCAHCEEDFEEIAQIIVHTNLADQIIFCDPKRVPKSFYEFIEKNPQIPCSYFQGHLMRDLEKLPVFDVLFYRCMYDDIYGNVDFYRINEKMAVQKGYIISTLSKNHPNEMRKIDNILSRNSKIEFNEKISRMFWKDTTIFPDNSDIMMIVAEWVWS